MNEDLVARGDRTSTIEMDDNHWATVQSILTAIGDLPGVMERVDAYMRGQGVEDPQAEICELRKIAF